MTSNRFADETLEKTLSNVDVHDPQHRWAILPDSEGLLHLIDLNPFEELAEPLFVPENDIRFLLYTRQNPATPQIITADLASLQNSNFNPNHETRFTIHGWQGSVQSAVNIRVAEAYFQHGDYNVRSNA